MRKLLSILLIILIISLICGCMPSPKKRVYIRQPSNARAAKAKDQKRAAPEAPDEVDEDYKYVEYGSAEDLFYSATKNYDNEEYDSAYILFDQIMKQYSRDILVEDSMIYQARMLFLKGLYKRAVKKYEDMLTLFPDTRFKEESLYSTYLCYRELGRLSEATEKKREFIETYPESKYMAEITLEIANKLFNEEDYDSAIEHYLDYYNTTGDEVRKQEVYETVIDIVENIMTIDELIAIAEIYYDKFPAAFIKLSLARSYLMKRDIDAAKFTLLEIEEFFPTFERLNEVDALLERIEVRVKTNADVIACLLPLTGKYEAYGQRLLAGIMLSVELFAPDGTENPITIVVKDTKGDTGTALNMLEEAYSVDGAIAVIGPLLSKNAIACAERAEELKFPIMLLTQKEKVTEGYDYVYRKFITNSKQVSSLVDYAMDDKGIMRYAVFYPESTYGRELEELFFDEVIKRGGQIVSVEPYDTKKSDFTDDIKKIVGLNDLSDRKRLRKLWVDEVLANETKEIQYIVNGGLKSEEEAEEYLSALKKELVAEEYAPVVDFEAIFVPDSYARSGLIIPQLLYHDIDQAVLKLGTSSYNSKKLIDIAQDNANGIVFVDGFFKDSTDENVKSFVKEYEETFKTSPTLLEAESYDSARILIKLIRERGVLDREEMKEALNDLRDYKGVTGLVKSFKNGDADEDLTLLTVIRQRIRQLQRVKKIDPEIDSALEEPDKDTVEFTDR